MIGRVVLLAVVVTLGATPLVAQGSSAVGPLARGIAAERRGNHAEAASAFVAVLAERPTDGNALLGLARVLPPLGRREELTTHLDRALAHDSTNANFLALAVRNHALLGERDLARHRVAQWALVYPGDEEPYREWALAALEIRDRGAAKAALELGRSTLDHPAALAPELAQLRQSEGDLAGATQEWLRAIAHVAGFCASATLLLGNAAPEGRADVLRVLRADGSAEARRLEGILLARWGEPGMGADRVLSALPESPVLAVPLLRAFLEELRGRTDRETLRARGRVLEATAEHQEPDVALRTLMDAARSYADAADEANARRLLGAIAENPLASGGVAATASTTLLGVLIAEERPAEAESLYVRLRPSLSLDDREREQRRIALAYARAGDLAQAGAMLEGDSTIAGFDVRGRLAAFAGDLATATAWLRLAGPYDDTRDAAVARVRLLALMEAVAVDTLLPLGDALLRLERGDTGAAVAALDALAPTLEAAGGAALRLLAGELAMARGDTAIARRLLAAADLAEAPAVAPAARLALASLHAAAGRREEATTLLEQLILDYPASAVVPEARRARDLLRRAPPGAT